MIRAALHQVREAAFLTLVLVLMALGSGYFFVGCGAPAPQIAMPNTRTACARAIECAAFAAKDLDACVNCIETVAEQWNAKAKEEFGDHPPGVESWPCWWIVAFSENENLTACATAHWYGPHTSTGEHE